MFGLCASKQASVRSLEDNTILTVSIHCATVGCRLGTSLSVLHGTTLSATRLVAQTNYQTHFHCWSVQSGSMIRFTVCMYCASIVWRLCMFTGTISCLTQPLPPGLLAVQIRHQLSKPTFMLACVEWFYNVIFSVHVLCNMVKHSSLEERVTCHDEPRNNCMLGQH